jgi:hypothetical protein
MCELLAAQQPAIVAAKVWLFGGLQVCTTNVCECRVKWSWHVASFVRVLTKSGPEIRVIDPSMFACAVTLREWRDAQNDPGALLFYSERNVCVLTELCRGRAEATLPKGRETDVYLELYRTMLMEIAPGQAQPPPFEHCRCLDNATLGRTSEESSNQASVGVEEESTA